jgi:two-component system, OmpR family, phosphate regulon response regulator PhoB
MTAQVLIVEDELHIQELLAVNLVSAGHKVKRASNVDEARALTALWLPDLVLLDWMMPGMSGVEYLRLMRSDSRMREIPVIFLSARAEERDKIAALEAGADDYITKPFSMRELLARIAVILRRRVPLVSGEVIQLGGLELNPSAKTVTVDGALLNLGSTEFRLLHFFITHADRIYTRSQLLDRVWGADFVGDDRTVDVHISRLRNALQVGGMDQIIRTVRGSGYGLSITILAP